MRISDWSSDVCSSDLIWDNKKDHPDGSASSGLSGYRQLYADALKWLEEGWVDYINPQIYFPFGHTAAPYEVLADWWGERTNGRHFYVGPDRQRDESGKRVAVHVDIGGGRSIKK